MEKKNTLIGSDKRTLEAKVKDLLKKHFNPESILRVEMIRDDEIRGVPIIQVLVVYDDARESTLDPNLTSSAARILHADPRLEDLGDVPVMSFIAKTEIDRERAA